jgi:glycosyltransferase involved in cell wall biosynthesis
VDAESFFASYPFRASLNGADVYHLTGQMLATLLLFQRFPNPVVVTVMDIIPYLVRHVPALNTFRHPMDYLFYRLALAGLRQADALVAISEYTKRTLIEVLGLTAEQIHVVYPAVDHEKFRSRVVPTTFHDKYSLDRGQHYILFVGSEDPRKNLDTAIRAFARVKQQVPDVKLLKVGASQFTQERRKLQALITELGLQEDVLLLDYVPDEDLPLFYNLADTCVMPSLYEGFGLPMAEAMACGTPVICASVGPLPEVVGEGGIQVNPFDVQALSDAMLKLLKSQDERHRLKCAGQKQAAKFASDRAACEARKLYMSLMERHKHGTAA